MSQALQTKAYRKRRFNSRFEVRTQLRLRNNLEKRFFREVRSTLNKNADKVANDLLYAQDYDSTVNTVRLFNSLFPVFDKNLRRIFDAFIKYNIELYDPDQKDFEFTSFGTVMTFEQLYKEYIKDRNIIFETLSANQSKQILRTIRKKREENLTLPELSKQVRQTVRNFSMFRSARIARTETHSAASFASQEYNKKVSEQIGQTLYKRWVSVSDARTRDSHSRANGQVRAMDEDFEINGSLMKYPGDPRGGAKNVINCRCVVVYVDEEDLSLID